MTATPRRPRTHSGPSAAAQPCRVVGCTSRNHRAGLCHAHWTAQDRAERGLPPLPLRRWHREDV